MTDEVSHQLHLDLRRAVQSALATRRPVLHHLNADTSWLLQIPRPESAVRNGARFYYNILIDPWLRGGQSDVASWFSQQNHVEESAVGSIAELEELAKESERLASDLRPGRKNSTASKAGSEADETLIDAVAISHEFTDHCHKETLLELHPDVPVFAIKEAAKLITSWHYFRTVLTVANFGAGGDTDWRSTSLPPLPDWIGISRVLQTDDVLNYHSALLITFNNRHANYQTHQLHTPAPTTQAPTTASKRPKRHHTPIQPNETAETAEALLYTPHGITSTSLNTLPTASPPLKPLALLHGLHNVRVGTATGRTALQSNLGAHNGLQAQRLLRAKYWIGTHDEVKKGGGLVAWFLQRESLTLKDAVKEERRLRGLEGGGGRSGGGGGDGGQMDEVLESFEGVNWVDLVNGESRVLV
ncbi:hypothetical protein B0A50_00709 [Salinomyces thailandicus]|uniref:Uncharacterized protein n=1 Tax=Salinomyces thailandicus TaxID=706561 RepID=A0A4U0UEX6_9PEZI|nr:hypothetical protein B0A50_00709 [Salinomyces thailandica]